MLYKALAIIKRKKKNKNGVFTRACTGTFLGGFLGALMKNGNKEIQEGFIQSAYEQGRDLPSGKKNGSLIT